MKRIFTFIFLLFVSNTVTAGQYIYCLTCENKSDFLNKAISAAERSYVDGYIGDYHVANYKNGKSYSWKMLTEFRFNSWGEPEPFITSAEIAVDAELSNAAKIASNSELVKILNLELYIDYSQKDIYESGVTTAWDFSRLKDNSPELGFNAWLYDNHSIYRFTNILLSSLGGVLYSGLDGLETLVTFSDGSSIIIVAPSFKHARTTFKYKKGSARTASGMPIPDRGIPSGSFNVVFASEAALNNILANASSYGISISINGYTSGGLPKGIVTIVDIY